MPISHRRCIVQYNTDVALVVVLCLLNALGQDLQNQNMCKSGVGVPEGGVCM